MPVLAVFPVGKLEGTASSRLVARLSRGAPCRLGKPQSEPSGSRKHTPERIKLKIRSVNQVTVKQSATRKAAVFPRLAGMSDGLFNGRGPSGCEKPDSFR